MPYAAGYEGFSTASKQKRTRIICTLGPASWCAAASNPATRARARNHHALGQPPRPHARTRDPMAGFSGRGARQARGYKTSSDDGYSGLFRDRGAPRSRKRPL